MRPPTRSTSASVTSAPHLSKSPVPYLYGGLAMMIVLIAGALVILVCSYRKPASSRSSGRERGETPALMPTNNDVTVQQLDAEPKIVVIMAGDDKPTYIAKPVTSSSTNCSTHDLQLII
ncbi:hypothetical protein I3843_03G075200 [Carya illinoinensis]|uniref:Uncharacterized protein n=1 Tax=Carya illinoinensis TaxID=32201 RepID=A0A922FDS0_CARIL|nr:hypothetical protein I3760_03G072600 [Carya illinoinensis]KAG6720718.1 hypothetical protein I3842_03G075300 [Carya illinoinensis]KAG7986356.1 hypothetical protein I3843_03G075200 [Carya illinoinensis]